MKMKFETACRFIEQGSYLECLRNICKRLADLVYSHHLMTRFHSEGENPATTAGILSEAQNEEFRLALIGDRREFWAFLQERLLKFLRHTENFVLSLSVTEIYDLLVLTNKLLEIGEDFSANEDHALRRHVVDLCRRYLGEFKTQQFNNLKTFVEGEDWTRLPLPDNYQISELKNVMRDYPHDYRRSLRVWDRVAAEQNQEEEEPFFEEKENAFLQFVDGNPFEKNLLISAAGRPARASEPQAVRASGM